MSQPPRTPDGNVFEIADLKAETPRRGFIAQASAIVLGGVTGLLPAAVGLVTFLNPLRKSVQREQAPSGSDEEGYFKVLPLAVLSNVPQAFKIIANRKDAWNIYPQEPIGSIYLQRLEGDTVRVFNVTCPHAGCAVDYRSDKKAYLCPCHKSAFGLDGARDAKSPSARDLDSLEYKIVDDTVWVKFQDFKGGVKDKHPA